MILDMRHQVFVTADRLSDSLIGVVEPRL